VVKKYDGVLDYRLIKGMIKEGEEGFVVRFKSGTRVKVKSDEYKRIHRLITEFSNVDIWKNLTIGGTDINKMLERVPDEFDLWVRENIQKLKMQYLEKEETAKEIIAEKIEGKNIPRKEIAEILRLETSMNRAIIFCMLDGMDYSSIIWKNIRPTYEKPSFERLGL
jgi:RNA ligase